MCMFSGPVEHVSATSIFARGLDDGRQHLVYSMSFAAAGDLAMVLPLPVPAASPEDAVQFVSLEGYSELFDDMARAFPPRMHELSRGVVPSAAPVPRTLVVHDVGAFEASFVPGRADFDRLDARFRLPANVWDALPGYADWGFAVFKLRASGTRVKARGIAPGRARQHVHPMALTFPRRDPRALFFPTVHVHDGAVHPSAHFDHTLYCQPGPLIEQTSAWDASEGPIGMHVAAHRTAGLVDGDRPCYRRIILGPHRNGDVELIPRSRLLGEGR